MLERLATTLAAIGPHGDRHLSRREFVGGLTTIVGYLGTTSLVAAGELFHSFDVIYARDNFDIRIPISEGLIERFRERPFRDYNDDTKPSKEKWAHVGDPMDQPVLEAIWDCLDTILERERMTGTIHEAKIAASFVCGIPDCERSDNSLLYPTEILAAGQASNVDKAILFSSLMQVKGIHTGLFSYHDSPLIFPGVDILNFETYQPVDTSFMAPYNHFVGVNEPSENYVFREHKQEPSVFVNEFERLPFKKEYEHGFFIKVEFLNLGNETEQPYTFITNLVVDQREDLPRPLVVESREVPIPALPVDGSCSFEYILSTHNLHNSRLEIEIHGEDKIPKQYAQIKSTLASRRV